MLNPLSIGDFGRRNVLVIGEASFNELPFAERNLKVLKTTLSDAVNQFNYSKAIIIAVDSSQSILIKECFEQLFPAAENFGITQKILIQKDKDFNIIRSVVKEASTKYFHLNEKIIELAETIARHNPGPPENDVKIEGDVSALDEESKLLLRRSFFDCDKIHVKKISGGKDSNHLLKVFAWIKYSEVGPLPLPFFAKISRPDKIDKELSNYQIYTDLYMSFQYRPNCRIERCVSTKNYKSLIGNFVDDSIPLRTAIEDTHHSGIIFSLFERSLKGFRIQPFVAKKQPTVGALKNFIKDRLSVEELLTKTEVIYRAKEFGLKADVTQLCNTLLEICPSSCLIGPIHGDLNSRNVMVRGNDAILIDFSAINPFGPLTADPATLEISLSFELGERTPPKFETWKEFVDEAYNPDQLLKPLAFSEEIPTEFSWLRRAIREIRHILIGCDCCDEEIKVIIACYLIRIARLAPDKINTENDKIEFDYRAYALVVAERIIQSVKGEIKD